MIAAVIDNPLLSRAEQILYGRLVRAFPGHVVLSQVAVSRLLAGRTAGMGGQAAGNRFKDWVADFVVCRPDFTIVAVVELAGSATSRDAERTRERKDESLRAAGIKVVRLPGGDALADIPNESGLKALVAALPVNSSTAQLLRRAS
jgi:hypothetical protein